MKETNRTGSQKKLLLLDAYALIYRAYYAFIRNPRYSSKGLNTSAIFGFTNTLDELIKTMNPTHIAVVFDLPTPTFRHKMFKEYKANREATPEDIKKSVPYIKDLIRAFNIPIVEVEGYEADDVIGTLAKKAERKGFVTYMITPDKDFAQLVSDKIFIYKPGRGGNDPEILGEHEIKERFHVEHPGQVIDILALWGDSSDNIPGAPGIGEKRARELIGDYGSIEELFNHTEELKGKQKENIEQNIDQIRLYKELVTIVLDVPVELNEREMKISEPDRGKLIDLFNELEFKTIVKRILERGGRTATGEKTVQTTLFGDNTHTVQKDKLMDINSTEHSYYIVDSEEKISGLAKSLSNLQEFCFDTETTGLNVYESELVGISFSFKTHEAYYLPLPEKREETQSILNEFKSIFEDTGIRKIGQNIKYDIQILRSYGIQVQGELFDTMLAHYILQPDMRHNLNYLAEAYLDYKPVSIEELIGEKGKGQLSMRMVPNQKVADYAAEDADITWQLKKKLEEKVKENNLENLSEKIEMPLVYVLADMERSGVRINVENLRKYGDVLREDILKLDQEIIRMAGVDFNIASPKQLGHVLFEKMKIVETAKKTKTRQYSTSEGVLMQLADKHEIIPGILEYRSLKKLLTTYVDVLPRLINIKTGKIHTSFNQAITSTGRLSSNNPNLQNIPIREEKGREIRKAFVPTNENYVLLSADYSQIELRLMAHMSEDPNMLGAFLANEDIHAATAAKINGIPVDKVTKEMRYKAKTANFGIIYGISAFGLSQRLYISRKEAKELIDGYFNTYPNVKAYMNKSIQFARDTGYAETIMGRQRYLRDINSRNAIIRGMAERNAINAPIQGSAADIIKMAMVCIHKAIKEKNYKSRMIIQVHDELVFDVYKPELQAITEMVKDAMQNAVNLKIPLLVDLDTGNNWLEAH
ncbi:DNA polymerase I [subsurface metagenome]